MAITEIAKDLTVYPALEPDTHETYIHVKYKDTVILRYNDRKLVLHMGEIPTVETMNKVNIATSLLGLGLTVRLSGWKFFAEYGDSIIPVREELHFTRS